MSPAIAKEEPSLMKNAVFAAYPIGINVFFNIITYFICKVKQLKSALEAMIFSHMSKVSREGSKRHFRYLPAIFYLYSRGGPSLQKMGSRSILKLAYGEPVGFRENWAPYGGR